MRVRSTTPEASQHCKYPPTDVFFGQPLTASFPGFPIDRDGIAGATRGLHHSHLAMLRPVSPTPCMLLSVPFSRRLLSLLALPVPPCRSPPFPLLLPQCLPQLLGTTTLLTPTLTSRWSTFMAQREDCHVVFPVQGGPLSIKVQCSDIQERFRPPSSASNARSSLRRPSRALASAARASVVIAETAWKILPQDKNHTLLIRLITVHPFAFQHRKLSLIFGDGLSTDVAYSLTNGSVPSGVASKTRATSRSSRSLGSFKGRLRNVLIDSFPS